MKGQVTIYTTTGCPHCLHAKQTFRENAMSYVDVSVDRHSSDVREWLKERTKKSSVPQIFFNNYHIGGNSDFQAVVKSKEKWDEILMILEEQINLDLLIPSSSENSRENKFSMEHDPSADVYNLLKESDVPHNIRPSLLAKSVNLSFSGSDFVTWFCQFKSTDEEAAIREGSQLVEKMFILPIVGSSKSLENDPKISYRLNDSTSTGALNSGSLGDYIVSDPSSLAEALRNQILLLYADHISPDGKRVNYKEIADAAEFTRYASLAQLLQRVRLDDMKEEDEIKAFFINIYNALVIHATVVCGPPKNFLFRLRFYATKKYVIGGLMFTLNDIENGILRANKRGVLDVWPPFAKSDPRRNISLPKVDPRIHFALNCGAQSCPPIKTFSAQDIDNELELAAEAYLESDEGVIVGTPNAKGVTEIKLTSLLKWYSGDFGSTTEEVLGWVSRVLPDGSKKQGLMGALEGGQWKVSYLPYSWDLNSE